MDLTDKQFQHHRKSRRSHKNQTGLDLAGLFDFHIDRRIDCHIDCHIDFHTGLDIGFHIDFRIGFRIDLVGHIGYHIDCHIAHIDYIDSTIDYDQRRSLRFPVFPSLDLKILKSFILLDHI